MALRMLDIILKKWPILDQFRKYDRFQSKSGRILSEIVEQKVVSALQSLNEIGLKTPPNVIRSTAEVVSRVNEWNVTFPAEMSDGLWALTALEAASSGDVDQRFLLNSIALEDHCYDGFDTDLYAELVADIISISSGEFPFLNVKARTLHGESHDLEPDDSVFISIETSIQIYNFTLSHNKDFDWSLIYRLNEIIPSGSDGRFAIFQDGGHAIIVFLPPENIKNLIDLCGFYFIYDEALE